MPYPFTQIPKWLFTWRKQLLILMIFADHKKEFSSCQNYLERKCNQEVNWSFFHKFQEHISKTFMIFYIKFCSMKSRLLIAGIIMMTRLPRWLKTWRTLLPMQEMQVQSLGGEDTLEKEMALNSSILAWEISGTEEPGRLQSMGSQNRHNLVTKQ